MAQADERKFVTFRRGVVRDQVILASFRNALRELVNPQTGVLFTEDEVQRATAPGSRFYIEADADDLYGQAVQQRDLFLADQVRPDRAATAFLESLHSRLWLGQNARLPATGGNGSVDAAASVGAIFVGSTTVPDPTAAVARDPAGKRYQVLGTVVTPASGVAALTMRAIDTGDDTNLAAGAVLTWVANQPLGAAPTATVSTAFTGGFPQETDQELAKRVQDRIRFRPAAGNAAHFRAWCQQASNGVESAFVYATALHSGSVVVAVTQKRGSTLGPLARVASAGVLLDVTAFIVPPNSPVVPSRALVVPTTVVSQPSNLVMRLAMRQGTGGGWFDAEPWPYFDGSFTPVVISTVTTQTDIEIGFDAGSLPGGASALTGANAPQLMVWDDATSRFEQLFVDTVTDLGGDLFQVELTQAPTKTLAVGDYISPYTDRLVVIAESVEAYFDALGPGEVVDTATDVRGARAVRFPSVREQYPLRAGASVLTAIIDSLGGAAPDGTLESISRTTPDLPTSIIDGPNMVTLGKLAIHPL